MGSGKTWNSDERVVLCSKFVCVSEDSSVGTGQKASLFWSKIAKLLNEGRPESKKRSVSACKSQFQDVISPKVSKFKGYHQKVGHITMKPHFICINAYNRLRTSMSLEKLIKTS